MSGAKAASQRGTAAIELAALISVTMFVMPTIALFSMLFFQYSVTKDATRDAAMYMATLSTAAMLDETERNRAIRIAQRMVADAAVGAGMTGLTVVTTANVQCDERPCSLTMPTEFNVSVDFTINDQLFSTLTGQWTDGSGHIGLSARTTIPVAK